MSLGSIASRRRFLHQTFAFSATSVLMGPLAACGSGIVSDITDNSAHLLMLGDWGAAGDHSDQNKVAAAMQTYVKAGGVNTEALLMLGDNFYSTLGSVSSSRWITQFENMYPSTVFNCPAYAIPGNHDYISDNGVVRFNVELDYAARGNTRWTMPSQFYRFTFPQKNPVLTIIALDSNIPYPGGSPQSGVFGSMTDDQRLAQLEWLTTELEKPLATPFLAVMGHHPLYSDGSHGDNSSLIRDWDALLRKHNVHLYLAGHDHDLQHLEFEGHPTSFFCSGGGGADLYNLKTSPANRGPYAQKVLGFSHLEATAEQLTMRHIDSTGTIVHAFTKNLDNKVTIIT